MSDEDKNEKNDVFDKKISMSVENQFLMLVIADYFYQNQQKEQDLKY